MVKLILCLLLFSGYLYAQSEPAMYFCEKYGRNGEVGVSDRFTTGYLTVVIKSDYALELDDITIQLDKYNYRTRKFEYYKKFRYTIDLDMRYVYFSRNKESDMNFKIPGIYRVFLLDAKGRTHASALVEIIK